MIRNHWRCQLAHNLGQDLFVNLPCREWIRQSFVNVPLTDLLVILVIAAKDDERRMVSKSLDIGDSFQLHRLDKLGVRRIDATGELKVLQRG